MEVKVRRILSDHRDKICYSAWTPIIAEDVHHYNVWEWCDEQLYGKMGTEKVPKGMSRKENLMYMKANTVTAHMAITAAFPEVEAGGIGKSTTEMFFNLKQNHAVNLMFYMTTEERETDI